MEQPINIEEVERLAAAAYTPKQVAFMLGIRPSVVKEWMENEDHDFTVAYYKGFYSSELAVRESTFQLARNGSSPAQTLSIKIFEETKKQIELDGSST